MAYTVNELAKLSGVSARTLRYYDEIGLLEPERISAAGYRIYGQAQVDRLQQILLYRELDMPLKAISQLLDAPGYDRHQALVSHLEALQARQQHLQVLIDNVRRTILAEEGRIAMTDQEKFAGLKERLLAENDAQYGQELKERYDEETLAASRKQFQHLSEAQYQSMEALAAEILDGLTVAVRSQKRPDGQQGQHLAQLHRQWLGYIWPSYSPEAHVGLAQMYLADERFKAYYDREVPGCAQFLHDAIVQMAGKK